MAKVKVTNICEGMQIAPSFKTLKPNMSTIVDESIITPGDKRLEKKGLLKIEPYSPEGEEQSDKPREIPDPETKPSEEEEGKIITASDFDKPEAEEEAEPQPEEEPEPEPQVTAYTRDELSEKTRDELREIGEPLGVKGRSIEKLIEDILKAQAK